MLQLKMWANGCKSRKAVWDKFGINLDKQASKESIHKLFIFRIQKEYGKDFKSVHLEKNFEKVL